MTHRCVGNLTIIVSDNGLSPGRRQAIIRTNAGILLSGPLGTNFNEILIEIHTFSFKKMHLKRSSAKWRPFGLDFNVLRHSDTFMSVQWWQLLLFQTVCLLYIDIHIHQKDRFNSYKRHCHFIQWNAWETIINDATGVLVRGMVGQCSATCLRNDLVKCHIVCLAVFLLACEVTFLFAC